MNALRKIDNIMFRVSDIRKAAEFYEHSLGLTRAWTDTERQMIGFTFPESDAEIVIHSDPSIPNPDFSFLVDDVECMCDGLRGEGTRIGKEPIDVRCGKFAIICDVDGNNIPIIDLTKFGGKPRYDASGGSL